MRSKVLISAAATAFVLSLATGGAKADTVQFTVVDTDVVGANTEVNTVTFDVPESPTTLTTLSNGFELKNVQINGTTITTNVDGSSSSSPFGKIENLFFNDASGGTELIDDTLGYYSDELDIAETGAYFNGSNSSPTFVPGTYGSVGDSLTITDLSATPLPTTWTMLLGGIIGLGWFAYRGRKTGAVAVA